MPLRWRGARLCSRLVGPLRRQRCESVCALQAASVGEPSLVAPSVVRRALTWCLPSLEVWGLTLCFSAQLQNKHGSSAFPETTGNLRHVPEYPLIGRYCFIHCQSNSSTDGVFSVLSNKETTRASLSVPSLWDGLILFGFTNAATQTKRNPRCCCCCAEASRKHGCREIFHCNEKHSFPIKIYNHRHWSL